MPKKASSRPSSRPALRRMSTSASAANISLRKPAKPARHKAKPSSGDETLSGSAAPHTARKEARPQAGLAMALPLVTFGGQDVTPRPPHGQQDFTRERKEVAKTIHGRSRFSAQLP